jgi:hypothetical protein
VGAFLGPSPLIIQYIVNIFSEELMKKKTCILILLDVMPLVKCRLVADAPGSYIFLAMLQNMYINFQVVAVFYLFVDKKIYFL